MDPIFIKILDYNKRIADRGYKEVTSNFVHETSSTRFHPEGLFSEEIFGQIASPERITRNAYINIHTKVFHPKIFKILSSLRGLYTDILSGKAYAGFNRTINDFDKCTVNDMEADPESSPWEEVGTGFSFFLKYFPLLDIKPTKSISRTDKILILKKYRHLLLVDKWLVLAAGLRDYEIDARGVASSEDINKLYNSLLNLSKAIPPNSEKSPIFDSIRYAIQKKINDINEYSIDSIDGKPGFAQRKYGYRKLAYATRNVITSPNMAALSPDSVQFHDLFETKIPLFQAAKAFQPLVIYNLKEQFFNSVFAGASDNVGLIDWNTNAFVYREIDEAEKNRFTMTDDIIDIINLFRNFKVRFKTVRVRGADGKPYKLYLMYDTGTEIWLFRNLEEFKTSLQEQGYTFDPKYVRDFTYSDMMYISTYFATRGRNATITRYPAIDPGSIYPSKVHLVSSKPGRIVKFMSKTGVGIEFPEYPTIGTRFVDSTILHPARLAALDADFDGDCCVSGTKIEIRFNEEFKNKFKELELKIDEKINEWYYASLNIEDFPKPGKPEIDKRGVIFYSIPTGCEICSYDSISGEACYAPIEKFSDEGIREAVTCKIANGRSIGITTNESIAVFDYETAGIKRVSPSNVCNCLIPVKKIKNQIYGSFGHFIDGWTVGSMISDGWVSSDYIGYAKTDENTRNVVSNYISSVVGSKPWQYLQDENAAGKLARSEALRFHRKAAVEFGERLDMYASSDHSALTKRISPELLKKGSREFLFGMLCGFIDGDGSISAIKKINGFSFDMRISTSSRFLVKDIEELLYKLGIRYGITTVPERGWSKESFVVVLSSIDCYSNLNSLHFINQDNQTTLDFWKTNPIGRDNRDVIPVSISEADLLRSEAIIRNDAGIYKNVTPSGSHRITRLKLSEYLNVIPENSPLWNRIMNTDIIWCPITEITSLGKVQTWDFCIPSTKTFIANEGVLIYDTISVNSVMCKEGNDEADAYYNSLGSLIDLDGKLLVNVETDLVKWTAYNLTRDPSVA